MIDWAYQEMIDIIEWNEETVIQDEMDLELNIQNYHEEEFSNEC